MDYTIETSKLSKTYRLYHREAGIKASLSSLFKRKYKDIKAVNEVSFVIKQGEMVGFIGPNGAGKTTTLKMLSGLLYPSSGKSAVLGYNPFERKKEFLKQISLVMGQKNQLWWDLPAIETFNLNKEIYEVPTKDFNEILKELSDILDVNEVMHQQVRKMSLGQRMKCELIASLIHKPKVLFLDEPTIGLDVVMQKKVREFIKEYNKRYNATVILTSHYMDDVKEVCKRVIIINTGQLIYDGPISDISKNYANYKILVPIFNSKVELEELNQIGTVLEFSYPKAVIKVSRDKVPDTAGRLLQKYDIDDLDINEPDLESIIREIFEKPVSTLV